MTDRLIGKLLVQRGAMTLSQVQRVLEHQESSRLPFGKLAHEMFGVDPRDIAHAWAEQVGYFCQHVDLACEHNQSTPLALITARQAWTGHILPLRYEGDELVVATTVTDLPEAEALLSQKTDAEIRFVIAHTRQLEQYIIQRYQIVSVEKTGT